ncbi:hypothetical protein L7F22_022452 [Adiantum nelumboides]|nr:hypothetical protein [Adiantum nelumboides]
MMIAVCVARIVLALLSCLMMMVVAETEAASILRINGHRLSRGLSNFLHINYMQRYDNSIPAAPVQGQANSCALDLSDELLGGVKAACMQGPLDKAHCCPVLAAWLMAARAKVALHPTLHQEPGMPRLPDDSLVCIASLKAALAARGIFIMMPAAPVNASEPCDVVTCFCGIHLSRLTSQTCPIPFSGSNGSVSNSSVANSSISLIQPTIPHHLVQHEYFNPNQENSKLNQQISANGDEHNSSKAIRADKDFPFEPSPNGTTIGLPTTSESPPPLASPSAESPNLLQLLAANCKDHSYRGCTRCLKTLTKEMRSKIAKAVIKGSTDKAKECEMIELMWLLELNKTLYIPTVSAVVRALLYNNEQANITKCSLDSDNMPLALDYDELLSRSSNGHVNPDLNPTLITLLLTLCIAIITNLSLLL